MLSICSVAISPSANAKHELPPARQPAAVIAHLALPGASVSQLVLQEYGGKQYLYVAQASKQGFAIVDVTKPSQPNVIKRAAWPNKASTGKLQVVGGQLALAEAADTATVESRTETLTVLDLSNPRTIPLTYRAEHSRMKCTGVHHEQRRTVDLEASAGAGAFGGPRVPHGRCF